MDRFPSSIAAQGGVIIAATLRSPVSADSTYVLSTTGYLFKENPNGDGIWNSSLSAKIALPVDCSTLSLRKILSGPVEHIVIQWQA